MDAWLADPSRPSPALAEVPGPAALGLVTQAAVAHGFEPVVWYLSDVAEADVAQAMRCKMAANFKPKLVVIVCDDSDARGAGSSGKLSAVTRSRAGGEPPPLLFVRIVGPAPRRVKGMGFLRGAHKITGRVAPAPTSWTTADMFARARSGRQLDEVAHAAQTDPDAVPRVFDALPSIGDAADLAEVVSALEMLCLGDAASRRAADAEAADAAEMADLAGVMAACALLSMRRAAPAFPASSDRVTLQTWTKAKQQQAKRARIRSTPTPVAAADGTP